MNRLLFLTYLHLFSNKCAKYQLSKILVFLMSERVACGRAVPIPPNPFRSRCCTRHLLVAVQQKKVASFFRFSAHLDECSSGLRPVFIYADGLDDK